MYIDIIFFCQTRLVGIPAILVAGILIRHDVCATKSARDLTGEGSEMTKTAILNTSIVTSFGEFKYSPVSLDEAREMVVGNPDGYLSAVGHEATDGIIPPPRGS